MNKNKRPTVNSDWFSPEQRRAIFKVFDAMVEARREGVHFWDNYGTLTAFNSKRMSLPVPDNKQTRYDGDVELLEDEMVVFMNPGNFSAGNADDPLYTKVYKRPSIKENE